MNYFQMWDHLEPNQYCTLEISGVDHVWINAAGMCHRVDAQGHQDGPALICEDGRQYWFLKGVAHRLDGPALVYPDGSSYFYLDGKQLTQEQWAADPSVIEFHSRTQQGAEQWLKQL